MTKCIKKLRDENVLTDDILITSKTLSQAKTNSNVSTVKSAVKQSKFLRNMFCLAKDILERNNKK